MNQNPERKDIMASNNQIHFPIQKKSGTGKTVIDSFLLQYIEQQNACASVLNAGLVSNQQTEKKDGIFDDESKS